MKRTDFIDAFSDTLAQRNLISSADKGDLKQAFDHRSNVTFEDFLLEEDIVDRDDLLEALSAYHGVPYLDVVGTFFNHQFLRLIPKGVMLRNLVLPYYRDEGSDSLWVVAANPSDPAIRELLNEYVSHHINFMVGLPQDIRDTIREFYDRSNQYQPNSIANQLMERSQQEVHTPDQLDQRIPLIIEETIDDYESK